MNNIQMFIQYHDPLEAKYRGLYHILDDRDDLDFYDFIRLYSENVVPDDFMKSIKYVDNTGDNIAYKDSYYTDLTALYWLWKNVDCDIIGTFKRDKYLLDLGSDDLISKEEILNYLDHYDFLVNQAIISNRSVYDIFNDLFGHEYIDIAGQVIQEWHSEYYEDFLSAMNGTVSLAYNIMICRKTDFDAYCEWLFDIISKCEDRLPEGSPNTILSAIAERLHIVWLIHNKKTYSKDIPIADNLEIANEILCGYKDQWKIINEVDSEVKNVESKVSKNTSDIEENSKSISNIVEITNDQGIKLVDTSELASENDEAITELAELDSENDEAITDIAELASENDQAITDLAEYIQSLEERIEALEQKED